jgi:hypothetical protein
MPLAETESGVTLARRDIVAAVGRASFRAAQEHSFGMCIALSTGATKGAIS